MVAKGNVVSGSGGGADVTWTDVQNKPATFPPTAHQHPQSDVTNLGTALGGKANSVHGHVVADTTGLQATLDGKSGTSHTHAYADVTSKPATYPPEVHTHAYADITGKPATFTPTAHTHLIADTTGLATALDDIEDVADAAAQVFIWNPTSSAYELAPGARIYIGPGDPGLGVLWINADPA